MLFAVDGSQNILGTFFSKGDFIFDIDIDNKKITGTNVMWLPTQNENEYDFDKVVVPPDNIKYLFHRDSDNKIEKNDEKIFVVNSIKYLDNRELNVKYITYEENIKKIAAESNDPKKSTDELNKEIVNALTALQKSIEEIKKAKSVFNPKGGGNKYFGIKRIEGKPPQIDTDEFIIMKNLVNNFENFVDAFITHPVMLKLNSLEKKQLDDLFQQNSIININYKSPNETNGTEINGKVDNPPEIEDIILQNLFFNFDIEYSNDNYTMKQNITNKFKNVESKSKVSTYFSDNQKALFGTTSKPQQIIHIKDLANCFTEIVQAIREMNIKLDYHIINDVFYIIVKNVIKINEHFLDSNKYKLNINKNEESIKIMDILNSLDVGNPGFIKKLNEYIQENISDKILTYVKINNFKHIIGSKSTWNKRFDILLNQINPVNPINDVYNSMLVKYNDINESYNYDKPDAKYYEKEKYKYPKQYLFGKFTKIFPPNMKNPDIASEMSQIVAKVKSGKPVFIMGYGASGSGKTSSLIYFNDGKDGEKEGIIIDICKKICDGSFDKIELTTQELFSKDTSHTNYEGCSTPDEKNPYINCQSNKYIFKYEQGDNAGKFTFDSIEDVNDGSLKNEYQLPIHHPYRKSENNSEHDFAKTIEYLIDKDRLVNATPNNPQSSRSHSFAFIKFISESTPPTNSYLIVGDFAGIENKFNCDSALTVKDFLNIKNNKDKTKLYYGGFDTEVYKKKAKELIVDCIRYVYEIDTKIKKPKLTALYEKINNKIPKNIKLQIDDVISRKDDKSTKTLNERDTINKKVFGLQASVLTEILKLDEIKKYYYENIFNDIKNNKASAKNIEIYDKYKDMCAESDDFDEHVKKFREFEEENKKYDEFLIINKKDEIKEITEITKFDEKKKEIEKKKNEIETMQERFTKYQLKLDTFFLGKRESIQAYQTKNTLTNKIPKITESMESNIKGLKELIGIYKKAKENAKTKLAEETAKLAEKTAKLAEEDAQKEKLAKEDAQKEKLAQQAKPAEEARRKQQEEEEAELKRKSDEKQFLIELSNGEINEDYLQKQIEKIYNDYNQKFIVNIIIRKTKPNVKDIKYLNDENNFKSIFYKWIYSLLKVDFIVFNEKKEIKINMDNFGTYLLNGNDLPQKNIFTAIDKIMEKLGNSKSDNFKGGLEKIEDNYHTIFNITNVVDGDNEYPGFYIGTKPTKTQKDEWNYHSKIGETVITNHFNILQAINRKVKNNYSDKKIKTDKLDLFEYYKNFKGQTTNVDETATYIVGQMINAGIFVEYDNEIKDFKENNKFLYDYKNDNSDYLAYMKKEIYGIQMYQNFIKIYDEVLDVLVNILTNFKQRLEKGKLVCTNRRNEGEFINKSLQDMREDIKNIFYEKQKDCIFISPDYVNLCLEKYCPTHSDCFKKKTTILDDKVIIKSDIFKKIYEFLNKEKENKYNIKDFYKDILISVFCVLNISEEANNPPPVPYMDINELKIALKTYEKAREDKVNRMYDKIPPEIKKELMNSLKKTYYKIKGSKLLNDTSTYNDEHIFNELQTSSIMQIKFDNKNKQTVFETIFNNAIDDFSTYFTNNDGLISVLIEGNEYNNFITSILISYINKLVESIDNNNAISAIGTLEFIDQISKYHTTQTICFLDPGQDITNEYTKIYNDNGDFNLK
jgi:hypothetical protein